MIDWIVKFLSGFKLWNGAVIGKIIYYGILFVLFMAVYNRLTAPTSTQNIQAETVINQTPDAKDAFILLRLWRLKIISLE